MTGPSHPPEQPRIPRPPSKEEVDEISRDQGLIADEWAPQPAAEPKPDETRPLPPAQQ
ncbi:MAG: hypothetical protein NVSMB18_34820 [Acetobacteraceae bacterium]